MTDTSLTRSTACNLILLATLPTGDLLATAFDLEDRTLPARDAHQKAAMVQRELIVVSIFRRYIATADRRADHILPEQQYTLLGASLERLVAPPGQVLAALRTHLVDPALDLTPELTAAAHMQASNGLPPDVPPLGRIMTKARTAIAGEDMPILDPLAMKSLLMAQACLRAMLPVAHRRPDLVMRTAPADPLPLRLAQELANAVLLSGLPAGEKERQDIENLTCIAEELLSAAGLSNLARQLADFRAHFALAPAAAGTALPDPAVPALIAGGRAHAAADR